MNRDGETGIKEKKNLRKKEEEKTLNVEHAYIHK